MGIALTAIGWVLAVLSGEVAVSCLARIGLRRIGAVGVAEYGLLLPELSGCLCLLAVTVLGVVPVLYGAAGMAVLFAAAAVPLVHAVRLAAKHGEGWQEVRRIAVVLWLLVLTARFFLMEDLWLVTGRRRDEEQPQAAPRAASPAAAKRAPAAPAPPAAAGTREIPAIRDDDSLGPVPAAADVAAGLAADGVEVPPPWAALNDWVSQFVPESDDHQEWFLKGCAAGFIGLGEAFHAHAENVVNEVGLDPAYGSAVLDLGDAVADKAPDASLVHQRFHVIYGEIKAFVENGGHLPFNARQFFGGQGAPAPQDGTGEAA